MNNVIQYWHLLEVSNATIREYQYLRFYQFPVRHILTLTPSRYKYSSEQRNYTKLCQKECSI